MKALPSSAYARRPRRWPSSASVQATVVSSPRVDGTGSAPDVHQQERARCRRCTWRRPARSRPGRTAPPADRPATPAIGMPSGSPGTPRVIAEQPRRAAAPRAAPPAARRTAAHSSSANRAAPQVEQQRARRVGDVGDVHAPPGQPPDEEAVDGAERELARLGARAQPGDVVQQPAILVAEKYGSSTRPVRSRTAASCPAAFSARAARRRCGGPARRSRCATGRPSPRSHSTVVSRWLVMPMAAIRAPRRCLASASPSAPAHRAPRSPPGSCSTSPGRG